MQLASNLPILQAATELPTDKKPAKLADAARQFEALMIGELLKSADSEKGTWLDEDSDNASETAMGMAQTQLAQAMASRGGFGLANTIEKAMSRPVPATLDAAGIR
jgi:Rod binding domain-containing protein